MVEQLNRSFHFALIVVSQILILPAEAVEKGEPAILQEMKPIMGCEFFVCDDHLDKTRKDNGYQIVLLAKSKKGYHNLAKLSSIAYTEGFYYVPRIDRKLTS